MSADLATGYSRSMKLILAILLAVIALLMTGCSTIQVQGYVCETYRDQSYPLPGYQVIAFRDHGVRLTPADTTISASDGYYILDLNPGYYAIRCGGPDAEGTWFMVKFPGAQDPIRLDLPVGQENEEGLVMIDYTQRYETWWQSDIEIKEGRPEQESRNDSVIF